MQQALDPWLQALRQQFGALFQVPAKHGPLPLRLVVGGKNRYQQNAQHQAADQPGNNSHNTS